MNIIHWLVFPLSLIGQWTRELILYLSELLALLAASLRQTKSLMIRPRRRVFWFLFKRQLFNTGVRAVWINSSLAVLLGIGLADRGTAYLSKIENFADVYWVIVVRELAPLFSGIILIARSATAITAEVGFLQLNKEFSVLKAQGINPLFLFILPVLFAIPVSLLMLIIYFSAIAVGSSWLYIKFFTAVDWSFGQLIFLFTSNLTWTDILVLMSKALIGGSMIGLVSVYSGYQVGDRFTDVPRMISQSTTSLLLAYFGLSVGLSFLVT